MNKDSEVGVSRCIYLDLLIDKFWKEGYLNRVNHLSNEKSAIYRSLLKGDLTHDEWTDLWDEIADRVAA
ncbi:hypothetical protein [Pseudomonas phage LUZ7]|uniref:Uncharacterized protein n=1 Tax=Pseudomonas phage LUZ7 TaxID=655097 RepID=C8ZKL1_9CAUD|nr:hypothetical protein PP-LUZ7_gp112 [Pseudomonas phage LUZ7]CAZ66253.1 hypothetical protein [Pseudomonas phage LUZ7]